MKLGTYAISFILVLLFGSLGSKAAARGEVSVKVSALDEIWDPDQCKTSVGHLIYCYEIINALVEGASTDEYEPYALIPSHMLNPQDFTVLVNKQGEPFYQNELIVAVKKSEAYLQNEYALKYSDYKKYVAQVHHFRDRFIRFAMDPKFRAKELNFKSVEAKILDRFLNPRNRVSMVTAAYSKYLSSKGDPYAELVLASGSQYGQGERNLGLHVFFYQDKMQIIEIKPNPQFADLGLGVGDTVVSIDGVKTDPQNMLKILRQSRDSRGAREMKYEVMKAGTDKVVAFGKRGGQNGVRSYQYAVGDRQVGVVSIDTFFREKVCEAVEARLQFLLKDPKKKPADILIVDLRGNDGGLMNEMDCMMGLFLGNKKAIYKETLLEKSIYFSELSAKKKFGKVYSTAADQMVADSVPVVVLVNGETASASEVSALVFRAFERGWIVGQRTYGKGIVQDGADVDESIGKGLEIWATTYRYETLNGFSPHLIGVHPDFESNSSVLGMDGEKMIARFVDEKGSAFESKNLVEKFSDQRVAARAEIEKCLPSALQNKKMTPGTERWLRDQQLRRATEVGLCIPVQK